MKPGITEVGVELNILSAFAAISNLIGILENVPGDQGLKTTIGNAGQVFQNLAQFTDHLAIENSALLPDTGLRLASLVSSHRKGTLAQVNIDCADLLSSIAHMASLVPQGFRGLTAQAWQTAEQQLSKCLADGGITAQQYEAALNGIAAIQRNPPTAPPK